MEKYIRVDWPESQEWMDDPECWEIEGYCGPTVFVPEELYNRVKGETK